MPSSPIRKLVPFADEARARGVHVHQLNIGQPDVETPRAMIEAYRRFNAKVLAYGPSAGLTELAGAPAADDCGWCERIPSSLDGKFFCGVSPDAPSEAMSRDLAMRNAREPEPASPVAVEGSMGLSQPDVAENHIGPRGRGLDES